MLFMRTPLYGVQTIYKTFALYTVCCPNYEFNIQIVQNFVNICACCVHVSRFNSKMFGIGGN